MRAWMLAVGQGMPAWVSAGFEEYRKRLSHWLPLELIEIAPGERGKKGDPRRACEDEGQRLLAACPKTADLILLDGPGRVYSSEVLAERLQHWRMQGRDLAFAIGGPEGFAESVRARAGERWSLGAATLPHPLVRVIVAEQLYRAASILAHHPYHRA